ncbi:MAG TPA: tetratricopeptide repeat protein [Bacteroidia bacterium]|jgi:serine phosphatase RsbU (regulator of sigma subunit)|nr:tetratricopeptide repeat protein [Bacteroidia bacterium]
MKFFRHIFLLAGIFSAALSLAQPNRKIDSMEHLLKEAKNDTTLANLYNRLADQYRLSDPKQALEYAKQGLSISKKAGFVKGMADGYNQVGLNMENTSRFETAIAYYDSSMTNFRKCGDSDYVAKMHLNIANVYLKMDDYKNASEYTMISLRMQEARHSDFGVAVCNLTLGNIYYSEGDPRAALEYYEVAYRMNRISGKNSSLEAASLGNIGGMFVELEQYDSALYYYRISLHSYLEAGDSAHLGSTYGNLGEVWSNKKNADSALFYYRKALTYDYKMKNKYSGGIALASIGNLYQDKGQTDSALYYYREALMVIEDVSAPLEKANLYWEMSQTYESNKQFDSALIFERKYEELNDSIRDSDKSSAIKELKQAYQLDKIDQQLQLSEAAKKVAEEHDRRTTTLFVTLSVIGMLVCGIFFLMYRTKKKHNTELEKKNEEISTQKEEITSSIQYAKRIQDAIFPSKEVKYRLFPDAFVMLRPRDIVSGDFYWFAEKNGKKLIAAVDCTGHGVPGAFMSMIGNAFLNEIVNEKGVTNSGQILDQLREMVITSLKQKSDDERRSSGSSESSTTDGMDIALLVIDEKNSTVEFSGANNPLWILRKNTMVMEEIKGDKQPIGFYSGEARPFLTHRINVNKGDALYIFTDGYADQFGGAQGKKFRYKPLQELFINIGAEPMQTQENILSDTFEKWKGTLDQVDDVLVIGVRI